MALSRRGLCAPDDHNKMSLTSEGRYLQSRMQLGTKPMKRLKLRGNAAESLIDEMFANLN